MPVPLIAWLLLGGLAVAAATDRKKKQIMVRTASLRPLKTRPGHPGQYAAIAESLHASLQRVKQQPGDPLHRSLPQLKEYALRAVLKSEHEGGAKEHIARIMNGQRDPREYREGIGDWCNAQGIRSTFDFRYPECEAEFMRALPPYTDYAKARELWDIIYRHMKKGFYLKGGPNKKPPASELEQLVEIVTEALLSEVDPARAPDPSMEARYAAIIRRAHQVIDWPKCEGLEGCEGHAKVRRTELGVINSTFSGEERIARVAGYTGEMIIDRTRTLQVNLPTNFGDFLVEVALPALWSGATLAVQIWGAAGGDEIDWSYPENVYGGEEVNEALDRAKSIYEAAEGATAEGGETATVFSGRSRRGQVIRQ